MDNVVVNLDLPLVSVIIPAYNAEMFIERTLKSVLSQTYKNIEVLVVNDGSQDRTAEIVKSIAEQDQRVMLLQQPNSGVAVARNLAIQNSKGEFVAPIDADDIWYPKNIEKQVQCMLKSDTSVGLVYAWSVDIDEEDMLTGGVRVSNIEGEVYTTLVCHHFLGNGSASLIRRACFEKVSGYNCQLKERNLQGCVDWDFYLRIAENYQFRVIPEFLIGYRKVSSSMSHNCDAIAKFHNVLLEDIEQRHPEIPQLIYRWSRSSLYMYLARQTNRSNKHKNTLIWLYKALQADLITTCFRPGLYTFSIVSILKLIAHPVTSRIWKSPSDREKGKQQFIYKQAIMELADLDERQLNIKLRLFVENILHKTILLMMKKSRNYSKKARVKYGTVT
jgi:glycosyltransferase involved in cell wall biosynthesis